jgi:hypothetical protein
MTIIKEVITECPNCSEPYREYQTVMSNNIGKTYFTDCEYLRKSKSNHYEISICHKCKMVYWTADGKNTKDLKDDDAHYKCHDDPTFSQAIQFANSLTDENEKINIRLNAWRKKYRSAVVQENEDNMIVLLSVLNEKSADERVLKAEIARNIGDFDLSIKLLAKRPSKKNIKVTQRIRELSKRQVSITSAVLHDRKNIDRWTRTYLLETLGETYDEEGRLHIEKQKLIDVIKCN